MRSARWFQPDLSYLGTLIGAGWGGIASERRESNGPIFSPPLKTATWTPAAVGATIGALSTRLTGNRKARSIAVGGLVGSLLGVGATVAWTSRRFTGGAARRAVERINLTRDAHWLETHPITYA